MPFLCNFFLQFIELSKFLLWLWTFIYNKHLHLFIVNVHCKYDIAFYIQLHNTKIHHIHVINYEIEFLEVKQLCPR